MVENGVNGLAISPKRAEMLAESIIDLAENPESRVRMGEMKEYDWDKVAKQYLHIIL